MGIRETSRHTPAPLLLLLPPCRRPGTPSRDTQMPTYLSMFILGPPRDDGHAARSRISTLPWGHRTAGGSRLSVRYRTVGVRARVVGREHDHDAGAKRSRTSAASRHGCGAISTWLTSSSRCARTTTRFRRASRRSAYGLDLCSLVDRGRAPIPREDRR